MIKQKDFGKSSIDIELYEYVIQNFDDSKVILEFGSGDGSTKYFSQIYKIYSIEHNLDYIDRYADSNYIFAPLKDGWYDIDIVKKSVSGIHYDLIIVDGPPRESRYGFIKHYDIFNRHVPIIIDDYHRDIEKQMVDLLITKYGKKIIHHVTSSSNKQFVVLENK